MPQVDPAVMLVSLFIWFDIWGAMGLVLAVPLTVCFRLICRDLHRKHSSATGVFGIPTPPSHCFSAVFHPFCAALLPFIRRRLASWRQDGENGRKMAENGRKLGEKRARNSGG